MDNTKAERTKQWGNKTGVPRGWERFRSTTFLEFIGAKIDRALQAINLHNHVKDSNYAEYELQKLRADGLDSLYDARNYLEELIKRCEADPKFLTREEMP